MHTASYRAADREAQHARRDRAVLGEQRAIGEKDARCVIADGAAVQQFPRFAVGIDRPAADKARIEEIQALFARPIDLPVLLADQHRLALMDGDLRWADLNLDRHEVLALCLPDGTGLLREVGLAQLILNKGGEGARFRAGAAARREGSPPNPQTCR